MGSTLPRSLNPSMTNEQKLKRLEKADQYCKRALDLLPTFVKPDYLNEEQFKQAKDQNSKEGLRWLKGAGRKYEGGKPVPFRSTVFDVVEYLM